MGLIESIFGTHSDHELKRINPIVDKVFSYEEEYSKLSDHDLAAKTEEFKKRYEGGEALDSLLPEAFATVREASWRVLGMKPYRVQVIGGIILHQGRIAEMKTGEGKTLVATMPVYLNALTGKGVHVVTVNDYLAKRDSEWMGKIYKFLNMTVGLIIHDIPLKERQKMYACDIVYGTNNEYGFDYLRDNMVVKKENIMQRELNYAIVDEVDSILIDEARTPLIISGRGTESSDLYKKADTFVKTLKPYTVVETDDKVDMDELVGDADYVIDEKAKTSVLTANGIAKAEKFFNIENLSDPDNFDLQHYINNALKANGNFKKDQQYIVQDGEVVIVDDFTGRLMPGRRYSDGVHQAIEAKENVKVANENKTLATITFQNFFRMYTKLSGMTGTAYTEEAEFRQIYNLDVIQIPTNKPVARIDENDGVFKTENGKYAAILKAVKEANKNGQPVLVGTVNVDKSELLSRIFTKYGIKHNVLNAKNHMREAEIVAQAGRKGAVTIATNMAGRGTDIKLDDTSRELGGLLIIGTERHESRRIDNQLRGRAGRQGDPGESVFYISLEDDLMRLFGSERLISIFNALGIPENQRIEHKSLSSSIERAQKRIENNNFSARKNVLQYDQVMNEQREVIYGERRRVLDGESMRDVVYKMITDIVEGAVDTVIGEDSASDSWDYTELNNLLLPIIPLKPITPERAAKRKNALMQQLKEEAVKLYEAKEAEFPDPDQVREVERVILLRVIDRKWMTHIDDMDQLEKASGLAGMGQKDPLSEFKISAFDMFQSMEAAIKEDTVRLLFSVKVEQKVEREQVAKVTGTNKDDSSVRKPKMREEKKVYPNDPCPCGSGKKYKNCHGRVQ